MNQQQLESVLGALPGGRRTLFPYFKDRYALVLLSYAVGAGKTIRAVKESAFGGLLDKPLLKAATGNLPDGRLTAERLACIWPCQPEYYRLTLGTWGPDKGYWNQAWYQVSRPGKNLVVQLNFSAKHNRPFLDLIRPEGHHPFAWHGHPIATNGEHTMAWARLDIEPEAGEALIEEVQTDWIRAARLAQRVLADLRRRPVGRGGGGLDDLQQYVEEVLEPHIRMWDEAVLTAALWFLREKLGIRRIYYHTYEGGRRLKGMPNEKPPRSIYSKLPRRFCFRETEAVPSFLLRHRRVRKQRDRGGLRFFVFEC